MKRRTLLRNTASTGLLAMGATSVAAATTNEGDFDPEDLPDDPTVSVLDDETGERVEKPLSETDATLSDCCVVKDGCDCACHCCIC
ncbi:hypothetical protein M0R89_16650 [Halorussus limi]|uniref:Uncharacterized protein n=1 Tax=Halorussus limi TaxID=2938695 RepID=A0A8U0HTX8_9EURY|nr:hypothetical protein [Halorussus limi]UPV74156.1 hypothetical protein M0R89_16650 [Halorussus limi]